MLGRQSFFDLTGLLNGRGLEHRVRDSFPSGLPSGALLHLAIDKFGSVGDNAGHVLADRVLAAIAQVIGNGAGQGTFLARSGGEHYVLLLPGRSSAEELEQAAWLTQAGSSTEGRLVGIGGTVRNLAAAAQRLAGLPSNGVQGMVIEAEALDQLVERLGALPAAERASVPGIKPARADLILAGAVVVQAVLRAGGFSALETTEAGLREGVFFERLLAARKTPDRPPLFADVRRTSVLNMAAQYRIDVEHTEHVAMLALGMFDELARLGLHPGDPHERELLWAACMLHDIGMSIDYDDHHKHSRYLILNGGLAGFSPLETAIIAQAARYHRKGMPAPGPMSALFGEGDSERLDRLAVLLRLAEDLERSRDQLVQRTTLELDDGTVQLRLIADGESAVPRWAAGRERELFQRAFHRELSVAA